MTKPFNLFTVKTWFSLFIYKNAYYREEKTRFGSKPLMSSYPGFHPVIRDHRRQITVDVEQCNDSISNELLENYQSGDFIKVL